MSNTNTVQTIQKPNSQVEVQFYNKALCLIAEVVQVTEGFQAEYFRLGPAGEYVKCMKSGRGSLEVASALALAFAQTGVES